ncbi:MAG: GLPGLI family protein [Flavobacteriales bacterium]|nr:MAG: GLPGLI family protein [Flavobacteriales bacterium]
MTFLLLNMQIAAQQVRFTQQGTIEYEKKVNVHAILKKSINKDNEDYMKNIYEQYKASQPQFVTLKSVLTFSKEQSVFKPAEESGNPTQNMLFHYPGISQINIVHTDFEKQITTTQKTVFEEVFLVKDSIRTIKWKITDETREIAGFHCRRANAIVMDSIYVVAYYSDKITVSGGPESFNGLPGMILGLALPHDHINWFATKVNDQLIAKTALLAPAKGKALDNKGFKSTLNKAFKQWGKYAEGFLKFFLL